MGEKFSPTFENSPPPEVDKNPTPEPLLTALWHRTQDRERGEETNEPNEPKGRDYEAYESITAQIDSLPKGNEKEKLKKLFNELNKDIAGYIRAIAILEKRKIEGEMTATHSADTLRRQAHTRLIDSLNILSRAMKAAGLDNSWRSVVGLSRKDATRWAWKIAKTQLFEEAKGE
jgi:hypothetical protein